MWAVSSAPLLRDLPLMASVVQDTVDILFESDTVSSNQRKKERLFLWLEECLQ